jgi:hypothetical protein
MYSKQGAYALPEIGNYLELVDGSSYRLSPISFHEFLAMPEALFFFDDEFFQIPRYEQESLEMIPAPDYAIEAVRSYIIRQYKRRLISKQDYLAWADLFQNHLEDIRIPFWAQVNLQTLMTAKELEMDETTSTRINSSSNTGGQTTTSSQRSGQKSTQDTDSSSRAANLTAVATGDVIDDNLNYDWSEAADGLQETRTRAGDMTTKSLGGSTSTTSSTGGASNIASDSSEYTNKMFTQERKMLIETAVSLLPMRWLKSQLEPCFWGLF